MQGYGVGRMFVVSTLACSCVVGGASGCSRESGLPASGNSSTSPGISATASTHGEQQLDPVFAQLAEALSPVPVFGLERLPSGLSVAATWWPVLDGGSPADPVDSNRNPHIVGEAPGEAEGQLVLNCGEGWVVILANFRGDLGDVAGEAVGSVGGKPAHLYQLSGGWLVQWAHEGRWYGVFGRGVPRDVVTSTALSMVLVSEGRQ